MRQALARIGRRLRARRIEIGRVRHHLIEAFRVPAREHVLAAHIEIEPVPPGVLPREGGQRLIHLHGAHPELRLTCAKAQRAHPGARVRARLQFLRGDLRAVDLTPSSRDLERFAAAAPRLAWEAHRGGGDVPPAELGRDEARCRAEGCGYVSRCYPQRRGAPASDPAPAEAAIAAAPGE